MTKSYHPSCKQKLGTRSSPLPNEVKWFRHVLRGLFLSYLNYITNYYLLYQPKFGILKSSCFLFLLELSKALLRAVKDRKEKTVDDIMSSINSKHTIRNVVNFTDQDGKSILHWAHVEAHINIFNRLVENGATNPNKLKIGKVNFEYLLYLECKLN